MSNRITIICERLKQLLSEREKLKYLEETKRQAFNSLTIFFRDGKNREKQQELVDIINYLLDEEYKIKFAALKKLIR